MNNKRTSSRWNLVLVAIGFTCVLTSFTALGADDLSFELSLREHKFTPSELTIPADKRVKLTIKNLDSTPAEFESHNFKVEHGWGSTAIASTRAIPS